MCGLALGRILGPRLRKFQDNKNYTWFTTLETKRSNQHRCFFFVIAKSNRTSSITHANQPFVIHDSKHKGPHTHRANSHTWHIHLSS